MKLAVLPIVVYTVIAVAHFERWCAIVQSAPVNASEEGVCLSFMRAIRTQPSAA
jgi:hypothetical protein